jgi:hypothetical protein
MKRARRLVLTISFSFLIIVWSLSSTVDAQALSAGSVNGAVVDPNGAVVPNASVTLANPITGYKRTTSTDTEGNFRFNDVPPNNYQLAVSAVGFSSATQTLTVRTAVPINLKIPLDVGNTAETVTVTGSAGQVIENIPTTHTDVDQTLIERLPVRSAGSGLSDVITLAAPGVVADSNGFFHPLGDHAQTS